MRSTHSSTSPIAPVGTVERVVHDIGGELPERRDADPRIEGAMALRREHAPDLAIAECDGGRIRGRLPDPPEPAANAVMRIKAKKYTDEREHGKSGMVSPFHCVPRCSN